MQRAVVVAGGEISDYARIRKLICSEDYLIYCDSGLRHINGLMKNPDLIIGDFDSHEKPTETNCECIVLPCEKDDTDSFFALKQAIESGYKSVLFLGCTGGRLDHTFANLSAMCYAYEHGVTPEMADDYSVYKMIAEKPLTIKNDECEYFSVIPIDGKLNNLTIIGAKYPLENASVDMTYLYSVSNEVADEQSIVDTNGERALIILDY